MIKMHQRGMYYADGKLTEKPAGEGAGRQGAEKTMAYRILQKHNTSKDMKNLQIKFDQLISHDITYVGIIQTCRASGLEKFPVPYVLTNCHNSLCAVGGTINEDDHMFGLSCAKKYGGIYVPPHQAVIHQYAREMMAGCGQMILGSDSHTRYGALGTMAVGEGGPELVKQLLGRTYDIQCPQVVGVYLTGKPAPGVGPQDVAIAIVGAVCKQGFVKNKVMEFFGPGVKNLSVDFRIGIDVMTTETTCLSSIWETDTAVKDWLALHGREDAYAELKPENGAYYDGVLEIELDKIKPMIALPFHPSNAYTIEELQANLMDILAETEKKARVSLGDTVSYSLRDKVKDGRLYVEQGIIAGCAGGGYENICAAADILKGTNIGADAFTLSVYPASIPVMMELMRNGAAASLMASGAVLKTAFCGPCFGAGDTPANGALRIRHSTRNFPNREGSKVQNGQVASVALMDARSIAATAANKGYLTPATEVDADFGKKKYYFDKSIYEGRVFDSKGVADESAPIQLGPNIKDWPAMCALTDDLLLKVVSEIHDPVTTTDELIPSGETSSFRSNPLGLAEFALSRKDPQYVGRAKAVQKAEQAREAAAGNAADANVSGAGKTPAAAAAETMPELENVYAAISKAFPDKDMSAMGIGSTIFAVKPGDGSAREQAASCQKVLGGWANVAHEYATKRYRSNLINWGMLPFVIEEGDLPFKLNDYLYIPGVRKAVEEKVETIEAYAVTAAGFEPFALKLGDLTDDERQIILDGCLINYYRNSGN